MRRSSIRPPCAPLDGRSIPTATIGWIAGWDLLRREACWVPAEIVHTDYTRDPDGFFLAGSNGLASGNHLVEAAIAAICELIERDALALWQAGGIRHQAASAHRPCLDRRPGRAAGFSTDMRRPASTSAFGT